MLEAAVWRQISELVEEDRKRQQELEEKLRKTEQKKKRHEEKLKRLGKRLISKTVRVIKDIPQFRDAAVEFILPDPQGDRRDLDEPISFDVNGLQIMVNFFPFDISELNARMNLTVISGNLEEILCINTNFATDKKIQYTKTVGETTTMDIVSGRMAALKGLSMLRKIREAKK
jgi:hypothetical protein